MHEQQKEKHRNKCYYEQPDAQDTVMRQVASQLFVNILTISGKTILQFKNKQHMREYVAEYCLAQGLSSLALERVQFGALMRQEHIGGKRQRAQSSATVKKEEIALLFGYRLIYIPRDTLDREPTHLWSVAKVANGRPIQQMIQWGKRSDALLALRMLRQGKIL